jgi:hypothetical protein
MAQYRVWKATVMKPEDGRIIEAETSLAARVIGANGWAAGLGDVCARRVDEEPAPILERKAPLTLSNLQRAGVMIRVDALLRQRKSGIVAGPFILADEPKASLADLVDQAIAAELRGDPLP